MPERPEYVSDDSSGNARIAREGYEIRKAKENALQMKLRKSVQNDEQKRIDKHNEGVCWGCLKKDYILSSLWMACKKCIDRRGFDSIYTIVKHKSIEDTCDFCGQWTRPFECWQINAGLCESCHNRVIIFHANYRKAGGKNQNPYTKRVRKKYGKDYKQILSGEDVIRKVGI